MLAAAMLTRDPADRSSRLAALLLTGTAFWAFCEVLWNVREDGASALAIVKASALGWVWVGPLSLHLFLEITGERAPRVRRALPRFYAAGAAFLVLDWTTPFVHSGIERASWGWAYQLGPAYPLFYTYTIACIVWALAIGTRAYRTSASPAERSQARWVGGGILVPLFVASVTDGILPFLGVQWPRLGTASFAALGAMIGWSFYRYGFSLLAPGAFAGEILETLPDGVAMLRNDGRIRSANGTLARMAGRAPAELVGLPIDRILVGFEAELPAELHEAPGELRTGGGGVVSVSVSTTRIRDRQQAPIGVVLVVRDMREVVSLRNRLLLSGRLAAVGELAAGIAHEINNPLAYVHTNLSLLRRQWGELSAEVGKHDEGGRATALLADGEEMIDESLEGVERATAIVRDVRGLAHAGGAEFELADLHPLLDGVARLAAPQLPSPSCLEKRYGEIPRVRCAPQELQQVFLNLVLNAGHAIDADGTIRVETDVHGDSVVVRIADDGEGIAPEVAERIFDPFFTTKAVGEGTGLGLSIAYEIVRRHGGEIVVDSAPGGGACFSVRLPVPTDRLDG